MKMTKDEFETATGAMIDLLEDPLFLCRENDAQEAVIAIKEIQKSEFEISAINEFQVITEKLEALKSQHDVLRDEVDTLKTDMNEEKDKLSNVLENEEEIQKAVEDLQMEICRKESQIKEMFIDLAFVKKKVHEDLQLSERINVRVKAVEDSLQRTDIEVRDIGLDVKAVKHQMAEMRAAMTASKIGQQENDYLTIRQLTKVNAEMLQTVRELELQLKQTKLTLIANEGVCGLQQEKLKELEYQNERLVKEQRRNNSTNDCSTTVVSNPIDESNLPSAGIQESLKEQLYVTHLQKELKEKKETNDVLKYTVASLMKEIHDLRSQDKRQETEREIQDLKSRNCILEAKIESYQSNEKLLIKQIEESSTKLSTEKEKVMAIQCQLENFMSASKSAENRRQAEQEKYTNAISGLKIQIQFLEDDIEDKENLLKECKNDNITLNSKICQLIDQTEETGRELERSGANHDEEMRQMRYKFNELEFRLANEIEKCKTHEHQLQYARSEIDNLEKVRNNETQIYQKTLSVLKENVKTLEKTGKQREEDIKAAKDAESLLRLQIENLRKNCEKKTNDFNALEERYECLKLDLDRSDTEVKTLTDVIEKLTYKLKIEESKNKTLTSQIENYQLEISKLKSENKQNQKIFLRIGTMQTKASFDADESMDEWLTPDEEVRSSEYIPDIFAVNTKAPKVKFTDTHPQTLSEKTFAIDKTDSVEVSDLKGGDQRLLFPTSEMSTARRKVHKQRVSETEENLENKGLLNMKVDSRRQVDVMLEDDKTCPWVSGCVFIPNGKLVLCDCRNNKVKVLGPSLTIQDSLSLHAQPWDIAVVNATTVIVSLLNSNQLQFVQVEPLLEKQYAIKLPMMCWGVGVVKDEIFITCLDTNGVGSVRIVDLKGVAERQINIQSGLHKFKDFEGPYNLTVSPVSGNIFVSDYRRNVLTCMNSEGHVIYQYEESLLKGPRGMFVDNAGNIMLCSARAFNLQIIDAEGVRHRTFSSSKDKIMKPWSVAYRNVDKTLIVGCQGKNLLVIGLEYSRRRRESTHDKI